MRSWLAVTAAVALAACAPSASPRLTSAPDPGTPLEARLFPPYYGQVALQLSKPAYVALFEVIPGRGVSLLYPQAGGGFQQTRELWVPLRYSAQRWLYTDASPYGAGYGSGIYRRSAYDGYGRRADGSQGAPRYLFLVASEEPLAVDQFQGDAASLRNYLGVAQYAAYEPYDVMERLAYAMLPFAPEDSWVTDVYVDWGYDWGYGAGPGMTSALARYETVRCADGSLGYARYSAGWGWSGATCMNGMVAAPGSGVVVRPRPGDSTVVTPPVGGGRDRADSTTDAAGRRRAVPAQDAATRRAAMRIAELRAEAERPSFRSDVDAALRQGVRSRQATDERRGYAAPSVWEKTRPARATSRDGATGARSRTERDASTAAAARRAERAAAAREAQRRGDARASGESASPRSRDAGSSQRPTVSETKRESPPPAEPSRSSGSSSGSSSGGGRSRVPPPGAR